MPGSLEQEVLARATSSTRMPLIKTGGEANRVSQGKLVQTRRLPMAALPQTRAHEADETTTWPDEPVLPFAFRAQPVAQAVENAPLPLVPPVRIEVRPERTSPPEVAPPRPSTSSPVTPVQRQPADEVTPDQRAGEPAATFTPPAVVQRAEQAEEEAVANQPQTKTKTESESESKSETESGKAGELEKLARQIYPLIKRMLVVERERRPIR